MSKGNVKGKGHCNQKQSKSLSLKNDSPTKTLEEWKQEIANQIKLDEAVSDLKYHLFQTRIFNFSKKASLIIFMALLVALAGFMLFLLICYIRNDSKLAIKISNVVQWIMSIVSLAIGIWGLILAKKSDKKAHQTISQIDALPVINNPDPIPEEKDVDKTKL